MEPYEDRPSALDIGPKFDGPHSIHNEGRPLFGCIAAAMLEIDMSTLSCCASISVMATVQVSYSGRTGPGAPEPTEGEAMVHSLHAPGQAIDEKLAAAHISLFRDSTLLGAKVDKLGTGLVEKKADRLGHSDESNGGEEEDEESISTEGSDEDREADDERAGRHPPIL